MSTVLEARAKAMIAKIEAETGKTVNDFITLAAARGLGDPSVKQGVLTAWLKQDFGMGHGHAMAMSHAIRTAHDVPPLVKLAT